MKTNLESNDWTVNGQCNGVIVHEDLPTESRARRVWNQLVNDREPDFRCGVTYQSAAQIKESLDFDQAHQTDIVIISAHDIAHFFFDAAAWLTDWLNDKSCRPQALFILHDGEEDSQVVEFLQTISKFAGVKLFSRGRETSDDLAVNDSEHDCHLAWLARTSAAA